MAIEKVDLPIDSMVDLSIVMWCYVKVYQRVTCGISWEYPGNILGISWNCHLVLMSWTDKLTLETPPEALLVVHRGSTEGATAAAGHLSELLEKWDFNRPHHGIPGLVLMGKSSVNGPFSIAMLNNQRVIYSNRTITLWFWLTVCHGFSMAHRNRCFTWVYRSLKWWIFPWLC